MARKLTEDDERETRKYESAHSMLNNTPLDFFRELEDEMKDELIDAILGDGDLDAVQYELQEMHEAWYSGHTLMSIHGDDSIGDETFKDDYYD